MDQLVKQAQENAGWLLLISLLAILMLCIMVALLARALSAQKRSWAALLKGSNGQNIEAILKQHLADRERVDSELLSAAERLGNLERRVDTAKRFIGMVRYDAFEDVGGNQSFSMAFFDDRGDGAVLTCLYGRMDCRVYAKLLEGGQADKTLTREESQAIELAGSGGRPTVRVR